MQPKEAQKCINYILTKLSWLYLATKTCLRLGVGLVFYFAKLAVKKKKK